MASNRIGERISGELHFRFEQEEEEEEEENRLGPTIFTISHSADICIWDENFVRRVFGEEWKISKILSLEILIDFDSSL